MSTPDLVAGAAITYLEGYLWDRPEAKAACRKAADDLPRPGRQAGADPVGLVLRRPLARPSSASWSSTRSTSCSPTRASSPASTRSTTSTRRCSGSAATSRFAALTRGAEGFGAWSRGDEVHVIDAVAPARGARHHRRRRPLRRRLPARPDHGLDLAACGRLGSACAAEIIAPVRRAGGAAAAAAAG